MKRVVVPEIRKENIIRKFFREIQNRKNIQIYKISLVHFLVIIVREGLKKSENEDMYQNLSQL